MLHKLLNTLDKKINFQSAAAHCDIPCKIYDPVIAQVNALTVIRVLDLIQELTEKESLSVADHAQLSRLVSQKEQHAKNVKDEITVIWGDYFKEAQFDLFPEIYHTVHNILLTGSKCKQHIDRKHGEELLKLVNKFATAFWETKGVEVFTATCPYPPSEKVIYPKLG